MRRSSIAVDFTNVDSTFQLHRLLSDALGFPSCYGNNWDAFRDAITGLVEMPEELHLIGWNIFAGRFPHDAQKMKSCLDDMARQFPGLAARVKYF